MASDQPKTGREDSKKEPKGKGKRVERETNQRLLREQRVTKARNKEVQAVQSKKRKRREKQAEKRREANSKGKEKIKENHDNSSEEYASGEKEPSASNITIRLFPSENQKNILNQWIGTTRWTYNQTLSAIKDGTKMSKGELRQQVVNNDNFKGTDQEWVLQTPYDVRDEGMNDVLKAYHSNFEKRKKNPEFKFEVGFRSKKKKAAQESFVLHAKHLGLNVNNDPREIE